jgi:hypothetical protein
MQEIFETVATAHNEALSRGVLSLWTIYDRPRDFPHSFVARRFEVDKNGDRATNDTVQGELHILRQSFRHCGLTCIRRADEDDLKIVETWL